MRRFVRSWVDAFNEHKLLTYATAIAMRALIGLVALAFLSIALLGPLGQADVWSDHVAPAVEPKLTQATFHALDAAVQKIFASDSTGLIAFAAAFAVWQVSGSIRAVMDALNTIVDADEDRSTVQRFALSVLLAVAVIVLIGCALFVVAVCGRLAAASGDGALHWLVAVLRWPVGAVFLGVAVGLVARFAPVEHRGARWASVGAAVIVVAWLVESAAYAWYLENFADYETAPGNLLLVIAITTYLYISSIVFLAGAQLDEFMRKSAGGEDHLTLSDLLGRFGAAKALPRSRARTAKT
jgi:membrane protein